MTRLKRGPSSDEYHQFDVNTRRASQSGRLSSFQSSGKSRSGFSDDEVQTAKSPRRHSRSNPILHQSSKENRRTKSKTDPSPSHSNRSHLSSTNQYRMDRHRRKALKLLIIIIVEFFICWTPLFIYHTFGTFDKRFYRSMPTFFIDLILLFSFVSPLCNPFTYYFMSKRYRAVLYTYFSCFSSKNYRNNFYKTNQDAQHIVKALHLHQQLNSLEYKHKSLSTKNIQQPFKNRANTVE